MSREAIRKPVTAEIKRLATLYSPTLLVEFDNELIVDISKQTLPFLSVQIKILEAEQADLSANPIKRYWGSIHLGVMMKEKTGTRAANELLDFLTPRLERKQFGPVRTRMGTVAKADAESGWVCIPSLIPFWSDQITA